ncbi:hypothetical protein I4U23_016959 [Adineta vaga]|nr:hypothetical protein I4U23_016959 [Adineta vaga]
MALAPHVIAYINNAFPNAVPFLEQIISKYTHELVLASAVGLTVVWERIYDYLYEQDPERITITSASEPVPASALSTSGSHNNIPNGYSDNDKKALEWILENATKNEPKGSLQQYRKNGTYEDAMKDFEKLSGNTEHKGNNVWVKNLPNRKTAILRINSTYEGANATLEIQKPNTKEVTIPIMKIRYL